MIHARKPSDAALAAHAAHRASRTERRKFTVVGPREVAGKRKGETVEMDVTPEQAAALIEAGHVVEAADQKNEADEPAANNRVPRGKRSSTAERNS